MKLFEKDRIKVFYAVSDAYSTLCAVSIKSILHYTKSKIDFYILYSNLSSESKNIINSVAKVKFIKIDNTQFKNFKNINIDKKVCTWYKILMPDVFKNTKKAIFLHADTMFLDDIRKLWEIDIKDKMLASVCDVWNFESNIKKFNLNTNTYFNEGVLVVNFEKWRNDCFTQKIKNLLNKEKYNVTEVLNILTSQDKIDISPKFNYMETWWYNYYIQYNNELLSEYNRIKSHPVVVHFTGRKPEYPLNNHYFREVWWEFASELNNYRDVLENFQNDVENNLDYYENILKSKSKNS